jgi:hypothetical protein
MIVFRPIGWWRRIAEMVRPELRRERERRLDAEIRRLCMDAPNERVIVLPR